METWRRTGGVGGLHPSLRRRVAHGHGAVDQIPPPSSRGHVLVLVSFSYFYSRPSQNETTKERGRPPARRMSSHSCCSKLPCSLPRCGGSPWLSPREAARPFIPHRFLQSRPRHLLRSQPRGARRMHCAPVETTGMKPVAQATLKSGLKVL